MTGTVGRPFQETAARGTRSTRKASVIPAANGMRPRARCEDPVVPRAISFSHMPIRNGGSVNEPGGATGLRTFHLCLQLGRHTLVRKLLFVHIAAHRRCHALSPRPVFEEISRD